MNNKIEFTKALYIKLGESGSWESDSISAGKVRFGWDNIPLELIKETQWNKVKEIIETDFQKRGKKSGATNDFNALKNICEADNETVFATFHSGVLYWCKIIPGSIDEDKISKFLLTDGGWSCNDVNGKIVFDVNQISGRLTKYMLFKGTECRIGDKLDEFRYLNNLINGIQSDESKQLIAATENLRQSLIKPIQNLVPKDFEILIDLIFRSNGWRRISVLGETMKFFDLVLEEPFTHTLHGVQVKSQCNLQTFRKYTIGFQEKYADSIEDLLFVVHSPQESLKKILLDEGDANIKLMFVEDIAKLVVDAGLTRWIIDKT